MIPRKPAFYSIDTVKGLRREQKSRPLETTILVKTQLENGPAWDGLSELLTQYLILVFLNLFFGISLGKEQGEAFIERRGLVP